MAHGLVLRTLPAVVFDLDPRHALVAPPPPPHHVVTLPLVLVLVLLLRMMMIMMLLLIKKMMLLLSRLRPPVPDDDAVRARHVPLDYILVVVAAQVVAVVVESAKRLGAAGAGRVVARIVLGEPAVQALVMAIEVGLAPERLDCAAGEKADDAVAVVV